MSSTAAALQGAARAAFLQGLQFTALIGAVSMVVAALVAAHIFRGARAPQPETP